jgi:hypothetical protein
MVQPREEESRNVDFVSINGKVNVNVNVRDRI